MNYQRIYNEIITHARERVNYSGYLEKHHVVPKFQDGVDADDNIVKLTPKEHFLCHLLLTKFVPENKRYAATKSVYMMLAWSYSNENRVKCVGGLSRKVIRLQHPPMPDGVKKKLSESTKRQFEDPDLRAKHLAGIMNRYERDEEHAKLSSAQRKRFENDEERSKLSNSLKEHFREHGSHNKGRSYAHLTPDERKKIFGRKSQKGTKRSQETKDKMKMAWEIRRQKKLEAQSETV